MLALEKPEDDIMDRKPRRPGKPILGKHILFRTFWVTICLVAFMIGNMQWHLRLNGYDKNSNDTFAVRSAQAVAMNTLVICQIVYTLNCRFYKRTSLKLSSLYSNPPLTVALLFNGGMQAFLNYTPGVKDAWELEYINGIAWLRVLMFGGILFVLVEIEKALCPYFGPPLSSMANSITSRLRWRSRGSAASPAAAAALPVASAAQEKSQAEIARSFGSRRHVAKDTFGTPALGEAKAQPMNVSTRLLNLTYSPDTPVTLDAAPVSASVSSKSAEQPVFKGVVVTDGGISVRPAHLPHASTR